MPVSRNLFVGAEARAAMSIDASTLDAVIAGALSAPSGDNCQPWAIERASDGMGFSVRFVPDRARCLLDVGSLASRMSLGALLEAGRIAAGERGLSATWEIDPTPDDPLCWATVWLHAAGAPRMDELASALPRRHTHRGIFDRSPLESTERHALLAEGRAPIHLQLVEGARLAQLARLIGEAERLRATLRIAHEDLQRWIRWTPDEAEQTRDGLDVRTLGLSRFEQWAFRATAPWSRARFALAMGAARANGRWAQGRVESSSAVAILSISSTVSAQSAEAIAAGQVMQRLWLRACALGLEASPMAALPLLALAADRGLRDVAPVAEPISAARRKLVRLVGLPEGEVPLFMLRVGRAAAVDVRSLRRTLDDVCAPAGARASTAN